MKKLFVLGIILLSINTSLHSEEQAEFEAYSQTSKNYDSTRKPIGINLIVNTLSNLKWPLEEQVVLDGGCGSGNYSAALCDHVGKMHGLDLNEGMLSKATEKLAHKKNVQLQQGSLLQMPYPDNSFHAVLINQILHHLETSKTLPTYANTRQAIKEAQRTLLPGGVLIINGSTHEQWHDGFWFYSLLPEARDKLITRHIDLPELEDVLLEEGFAIKSLVFPTDEILQDNRYNDPLAPLDKSFRDGDSIWGMSSKQEASNALRLIQQMDEHGTLQTYFQERDALRKKIGQTIFVVAQKKG